MEEEAAAWEEAAEAREAEEAAEEIRLYASAGAAPSAPAGRGGGKIQVRLRDSFMSVAPVADLSLLPPAAASQPDAAAAAQGGASDRGGWVGGVDALLCGGRGKSGCIARVSRSVELSTLGAFDLPPCEAVFTLPGAADAGATDADASADALEPVMHRYVLLSTASGSRVLEAGKEFAEVTQSSGVHTASTTLHLAPLAGATRAV